MANALSESTEMYLITIYRLTRNGNDYAHTKDIAEGMGVSLPSVSEKLKRLSENGYVNYEWRHGTNLTDQGAQIAISVLRKHRLVETFLVRMAGYSLDEVHEEACRLEHVLSDRLTDRIEEMLGYPTTDPHGHPIPTKECTISEYNYLQLKDSKPGHRVVIQELSDWNPEILKYLCRVGIVPGTVVTIIDIAPFDGPVTLALGDKTVALSQQVLGNISVTLDQDNKSSK